MLLKHVLESTQAVAQDVHLGGKLHCDAQDAVYRGVAEKRQVRHAQAALSARMTTHGKCHSARCGQLPSSPTPAPRSSKGRTEGLEKPTSRSRRHTSVRNRSGM